MSDSDQDRPIPQRIVVLEGYHESSEVHAIAVELIGAHPRFAFLDNHSMAYALLHGVAPEDGRLHAIAKAQKAPAVWKDLTGTEGAVWVNQRWWMVADEKSRRAVVAHELCHFTEKDDGNLGTVEHDVEEFSFVARHFGPWDAGLIQLRMALDEGPVG